MTRMSLALVLALAAGSYSTPGLAQLPLFVPGPAQNALPSFSTPGPAQNAGVKRPKPVHKSTQAPVPKVTSKVTSKVAPKVTPKITKDRAKAVPTDPAAEPEKEPVGTPVGLYDFTG
jgi:hypothetical protein